jgi:hypothetical protein
MRSGGDRAEPSQTAQNRQPHAMQRQYQRPSLFR